MNKDDEKLYSKAFFVLLSALEEEGYTIVPIIPTNEMIKAWHEGSGTAIDAYEEERRRLDKEGKKLPLNAITPAVWFPPAYKAMLSVVSKKWRDKRS